MKNQNYDLWCFLDVTNYGTGRIGRILEKHLAKTPEYRGRKDSVLYFEFDNPMDKMNFMFSIVQTLNSQGYRHAVIKENHSLNGLKSNRRRDKRLSRSSR